MKTTHVNPSIDRRLADELSVRSAQVEAAVALLDGGATVPFVARYRKEATGGLDDTQLRTLEERLGYLRDLEDRRATILESIREQGKLDDALEAKVLAADTKARLEDIYLPYKPKRRTKAQIAREAGLAPLAELLLADPGTDPQAAAAGYVDGDKGVADPAAALQGARAILTEQFAEDADLIGELRERMWTKGKLVARARDGEEERGAKFSDYFSFGEAFTELPSHRVLALLRGEGEKVLDISLVPDPEHDDGAGHGAGAAGAGAPLSPSEQAIAHRFGVADR
ncbi:MAG TPA: Tex-like N-terminal domain-containing protein, partial [Rhodothermales bacterium]|nr:Tex-like N-terminal domain-containing protein [Rhodothermales bacterium]